MCACMCVCVCVCVCVRACVHACGFVGVGVLLGMGACLCARAPLVGPCMFPLCMCSPSLCMCSPAGRRFNFDGERVNERATPAEVRLRLGLALSRLIFIMGSSSPGVILSLKSISFNFLM